MTNFNRPRKITIIGGRGRMGKFFTQHLSTAGHQVSTLGNQDWDRASQLLGEAEFVIVSVPIERTVAVIERAAKYLLPTTALADITSIKAQPVQVMLANHAGAVMGLHPMFGPSIKSFAGQKVVICSGRNDETFQWLLDFISDRGGELISCTPEEHDRIMVTIQATQHFSRFCCGAFLSAENIDLDQSLSMSTPSYRQEVEIVNRLFTQNPALCVDIMLATEERCEAIARLAQTYRRLAELIVKKDRSSLIREFEIAQSFLTQENLASSKQKEYAMPSEVRATITVTQ
ncbi:bifunctional chorismate mutase/prephenate dehydrogenase [Chroococcidiopsis sp. FACHB-1243]|uniref:bifunctional chorismate mutase/prephenate dehydrogenase n=1 Tax=Chroococcidiopsis sp. [FACHB-1243] TaxID=2692781 RepID=UPI0017854170|nr:bifunctional chorismate mutase/prephenate dehydrogenase [Chroococcidiopsis sp. [FACHB-1243]]MBD2306792.1 bifunctional chorismate mutase/prephenate dehydrogenase [Chroococcidiopsis sp. [FACHB-1243]]